MKILGSTIGRGHYRTVSMDKGVVEKTLHTRRERKYLGVKIKWPMKLYTRFKFLVKDLNVEDWNNFRRFFKNCPEQLKESFAPVLGIGRGGGSFTLKQMPILDFDGGLSRNLKQVGKISNPEFWERFHKIVDFLTTRNIPLLDIHPTNILVRRLSKTEAIPVLFDYKRMGAKHYPFQPLLLTKAGRRNRILKKARGIESRFKFTP